MLKKETQKSTGIIKLTKGFIYLMAFAVFIVCGILVPEIGREEKAANPNAGVFWPFLLGMWVLSIPIFAALFETHKILNYIDQNTAFSKLTVSAIQNIKKYSILFAVMVITAAFSLIFIVHNFHPTEDMPPIGLVAFVVSFVAGIIATFAATLEKLLNDALKMKEENDLTV